jgi:peroxiredoxin
MSRGLVRCGLVWAGLVAMALAAAQPSAVAASELGKNKFKVGDAAPDFMLADLSGKEVRLSSFLNSKVVLLNFWGLRCGACLEEMPFLEALHKKFADKGLVLLGVDTDGVDAPTIVSTMKEVGASASYTILVDSEFKATDLYTNFLVPLTIVVDRKGIIRYIHTGFEKGQEKEYEEAVKSALGS